MDDPVSLRSSNDDRWQRLVGQPAPTPAGAVTPPTPPCPPCPADAAQPVDVPFGRCPVQVATGRVDPTMQRDAQEHETQGRLDAFRGAMTGTYRTVDGTELKVAAPFQMGAGYANQQDYMRDPAHLSRRNAAAQRANLSPEAYARVVCGRGTPGEIHALAQSLLASQPAGKIVTSSDLRKLMFDNCIGVDCASYAQQAYLKATGQTRSQAGLGDIMNESLTNLAHRGFQRVSAVSDVRPGDVVVLGPPKGDVVGHRTVVYDQRAPTSSEMRALLDSRNPAKIDFVVGGPVRVLEVDSSWGCGHFVHGESGDRVEGHPDEGGVKRVTWLYNESTAQWATWDKQGGTFHTSPTPYDHPLDGFFRRTR
jgi:hypothetical protein